jgi:hypothetical protein
MNGVCPESIEHDVAGQLEETRLFPHQDRLVAALKDVTHAGVGLVAALYIDTVDLAHWT